MGIHPTVYNEPLKVLFTSYMTFLEWSVSFVAICLAGLLKRVALKWVSVGSYISMFSVFVFAIFDAITLCRLTIRNN